MTSKNYPPKPALTLNLDGSEPFEVECECMKSAPITRVGLTFKSPGKPNRTVNLDHPNVKNHPRCHGTGTRTVRLTGGVEIDTFSYRNDNDEVEVFTSIYYERPNDDGEMEVYEFSKSIDVERELQACPKLDDLIYDLTAAYRSGTLPAELMAGDDPDDWRLRIVEEETDDE